MLENIDFQKVKTIVELGPGTGIFTDEIIERLGKDAQLFVFELNDIFNCLAEEDNKEKFRKTIENIKRNEKQPIFSG